MAYTPALIQSALLHPRSSDCEVICEASFKLRFQAEKSPETCVPGLAWIGVLPSDLSGLQLPQRHLLPLEPRDYGKLATLAANPVIKQHPGWIKEVEFIKYVSIILLFLIS